MLSLMLFLALQTAPTPKAAAATPTDPLATLAVLNGAWTVSTPAPASGAAKPDNLVNHCTRTVAYYSCEQVVNGKSAALIVFVPGDAPGKYHTQIVLPNGYSTGRSDLTIDADHWTYLGKDVEGDTTTWYRTENYFHGPNSIHFEIYKSTDNKNWQKTMEGDETRSQT